MAFRIGYCGAGMLELDFVSFFGQSETWQIMDMWANGPPADPDYGYELVRSPH